MPDDMPAHPKDVLVLSWTVTPPSGMTGSLLNDPGVRLGEYLRALLFYLIEVPQADRILVLENSGYDFAKIRMLMEELGCSSRVTFVPTSTDYDPTLGKGFGEFRMYDEGLAAAASFPRSTRLWKITGRLTVKNLGEIITTAPAFGEGPSLYCDLRHVPFVSSKVLGDWMDVRLFAFNMPFYDQHFRGQFGCNYIIEEGFYTIVKRALDDLHADQFIEPRFCVQPIYEGRSGYSLKSYLNGKHLVAHHARRMTRRLTPWLWL